MLKALIRKQFQEILVFLYQGSKSNKRRSKVGTALYGLLMIYAVGVIGMMFFLIGDTLCAPLLQAGLGWMYFALMGTAATALGIVGSVFTTSSQLYEARDNEALLSMPIPPSIILFTRMLVLYVQTFVFEAVVMVPAAIVSWMNSRPEPAAVCFTLILLFLLPLLGLSLACLLGWLVALAASRVRRKNLITVVLTLLFLVAYYYVYSQLNRYLQMILMNSEAVGRTMKTAVYPMYQMGLAAEGSAAGLLIFTGIVLAVFAVIYWILSRSFLAVATAKRGAVKVKYTGKAMKVRSVENALLRKELARFFGSSAYLLNTGIGSLFLLVGAVFAVVKGRDIQEYLDLLPRMKEMLPLLVCALVGLVAATNVITAPSVSLEGKSIWLLQSLPVDSWKVLRSKIKLQLVITALPAAIFAVTVCIVLRLRISESFLIILFTAAFILLTAVLGLAINLKLLNLNWNSEAVVVKQSASTGIAMFANWGIIFAFGIAYYFLGRSLDNRAYILICALILAGASALLLSWMRNRGTRIFARL